VDKYYTEGVSKIGEMFIMDREINKYNGSFKIEK
jgi:hypothetical protein